MKKNERPIWHLVFALRFVNHRLSTVKQKIVAYYDAGFTNPKVVALIFLANILCVHVRKSDEMYASPTRCTHAKKNNATKVVNFVL